MDTELLSVFDEVCKARSVSRAGDKLAMPQTSVSLASGDCGDSSTTRSPVRDG